MTLWKAQKVCYFHVPLLSTLCIHHIHSHETTSRSDRLGPGAPGNLVGASIPPKPARHSLAGVLEAATKFSPEPLCVIAHRLHSAVIFDVNMTVDIDQDK
jgi:hypothetical protein